MTKPGVVRPYILTLENRDKYLFARIDGNIDSVNISRHYWSQIARVCSRGGFSKLLLVKALRSSLTLPEAFKAACLFNYGDFAEAKVAFVDIYEKHQEVNEFLLKILKGRGLNIRSFADIDPAEVWLLADKELSYKAAG